MSPTPQQYFPRHLHADSEVVPFIKRGEVSIWRKDRSGRIWFKINPPNNNANHRVEAARRDERIQKRDAVLQAKIESGIWPEYLASSAIGEEATKKLLRNGAYEIWRVDSLGTLWLRQVPSWEEAEEDDEDDKDDDDV